ncbi:TPA: mechanosensitive ion channel family protein [Vibrio campbellii]|nr:mechanosensitive ion channel family protein [Vibrio campbellii]HDM8241825.1 mechanosensitive ion channel family protein [Vibrio campbellii]
MLENISIESLYEKALELILTFGPKLVLAILVLVVGWWLVGKITKGIEVTLEKVNLEHSLRGFLSSFASVVMKILLVISSASMIGIETTSFIAMLGAAGLAVGMALQGSLSNFAGGVLILFFKPFKVGDIIEAQGHMGKVVDIQIFVTVLLTYDNQKIIIPNGSLSNGTVKNLFCEENRRIDIEFGISYGDDLHIARNVLMQVMNEYDLILDKPSSIVHVSQHGDSHIGMLMWAWVKSENYWPAYYGLHERVKDAFDEKGITIPFPQRDVHIYRN